MNFRNIREKKIIPKVSGAMKPFLWLLKLKRRKLKTEKKLLTQKLEGVSTILLIIGVAVKHYLIIFYNYLRIQREIFLFEGLREVKTIKRCVMKFKERNGLTPKHNLYVDK